MKPSHIIQAHSSHVNNVLFAEDGNSLYSLGFGGELKQWDCSDWSHIRDLDGHTESVNCGLFLNGQLVTGSRDGKINFYEPTEGKLVHSVDAHKKAGVTALSKTADDQYLLSGGQDKMVVVRNPDGSVVSELKPNAKNIWIKTTSADGKHALVGGYSSQLQVFSIPDLEKVTEVEAGKMALTNVKLNQGGDVAWCLDYTGGLTVLSTEDWATVKRVELKRKGVIGMTYSAQRNELAITADHAVLLVDAASLQVKQELESKAKGNYGLRYSPDHKVLALASADKRVRVWELTD